MRLIEEYRLVLKAKKVYLELQGISQGTSFLKIYLKTKETTL